MNHEPHVPTIGSLFSGIGGFELGFERAGFRPAWSVEIDQECQRVLTRHWPDMPKHLDVSDVGAHNLAPVDVITFGSPCQDLSVAGKRAGLKGKRSNLFYEAIRIIGELKPAFSVWENVPGAFSSHSGRDFAAVLASFRELGAVDLAWRTLDAQYFGVPQRRRRIFLVCDFRSDRAAEVLFDSEGVSGDLAESDEEGSRLATDLAASPRHGGGNGRGYNLDAESGLVAAPDETVASLTSNGAGVAGADASDAQAGHLIPLVDQSFRTARTSGQGFWTEEDLATPLRERDYKDAESTLIYATSSASDVVTSEDLTQPVTGRKGDPGVVCVTGKNTHALASEGADASEDGSGRGTPIIAFSSKDGGADASDIAPTMSSMEYDDSHMNGGGQLAIAFAWQQGDDSKHGKDGRGRSWIARAGDYTGALGGVRRLTPKECERLQGFPDGWTERDATGKAISDSARYRMLGNAVAVPVVEWLAGRVLRLLQDQERPREETA